jgi:hypothetical protein
VLVSCGSVIWFALVDNEVGKSAGDVNCTVVVFSAISVDDGNTVVSGESV